MRYVPTIVLVSLLGITASLLHCSGPTRNTNGTNNTTTNTNNNSAGNSAEADAATVMDASADAQAVRRYASVPAQQLLREASDAFSRDRFHEAAERFEELYLRSPSPELALNIARSWERGAEPARAIPYFERFLASNPPPAVRDGVQQRLDQARRFALSLADASVTEASTQELNQEGMTWYNRGARQFQSGNYTAALLSFEQAAQYLGDTLPELFLNLGRTHERLNHIGEALGWFRQYLRARENSPEAAVIQQHIRELESRP